MSFKVKFTINQNPNKDLGNETRRIKRKTLCFKLLEVSESK